MLRVPEYGRTSARSAVAFVATLVLCTCSTVVEVAPAPTPTLFLLSSCRLPAGEQPLPCTYAVGSSGDSIRAYGGTMTLNSDSTWSWVLFYSARQGGNWTASVPSNVTGTFSLGGRSASRDSLVMRIDSSQGGGVDHAILLVSRLDFSSYWSFQRQ